MLNFDTARVESQLELAGWVFSWKQLAFFACSAAAAAPVAEDDYIAVVENHPSGSSFDINRLLAAFEYAIVSLHSVFRKTLGNGCKWVRYDLESAEVCTIWAYKTLSQTNILLHSHKFTEYIFEIIFTNWREKTNKQSEQHVRNIGS